MKRCCFGKEVKVPTLKDKINDILSNGVYHYVKKDSGCIGIIGIVNLIMDEIDKEQKILRPALKWFAGEMEEDLRKNDFKKGWLDGRLDYYWGKAINHLESLRPVDSVRIVGKRYAIERCVKAANYMMMIAHNLIEELKKGVD